MKPVDLIKKYQDIRIYTHIFPDYDALTSVLAFKQLIVDNFEDKNIVLITNDEFKLKDIDAEQFYKDSEYDQNTLSIVLDTSDTCRVSGKHYVEANDLIVIDHHSTNLNSIKSTMSIIKPDLPSNTVLLYELAKGANWKINDRTLFLLGLGLYSDTSGDMTKILSTSESSALWDLVKDNELVYNEDIQWKPEGYSDIVAYIKDNQIKDNQVNYVIIPLSVYTNTKVLFSNINKDSVLLLDKNEFLVFATEISFKEQTYYVEIRTTNPEKRVDLIAKEFNGGGHKNRSGALLSLKEIKNLVKVLNT